MFSFGRKDVFIQPFGKGKIAFSYAVPDIIEEDQNQRFTNISGQIKIDTFDVNLSNLDKTYKFGPSYAQKINDSLAVGVTLYLHYRQNLTAGTGHQLHL